MGRRKPHSLRESNDPHAEGWDACLAGVLREANPYVPLMGEHKQTDRHQKMKNHNVQLWFLGWDACAED